MSTIRQIMLNSIYSFEEVKENWLGTYGWVLCIFTTGKVCFFLFHIC